MLIEINQKKLDQLIIKAKVDQRKRTNLIFHSRSDDPIQRMLLAIHPGTYVQPHRHKDPDKREVFIILTGKATVVQFDNAGGIIKHSILSHEIGNYGVEIPTGRWHTLIALEINTIIYEVKDGPYSPSDDKNFADWAPKEIPNCEECQAYLNKITLQIMS